MVLRPQMDEKTKPSSLTSRELNLLVFRYLTESGFAHAAFSIGYEAGINKTNMDSMVIPPGALITIVQKGLQYIEMEANLESGDECGECNYSFLQISDLITKDVNELQRIIKEKSEHVQKERDAEKERQRRGMKKWQKKRSARKVEKGKDQKDDKIVPEPMDISPSSFSRACEFLSSEVKVLEGHVSEVFSCAWSPIGPYLASGSKDSTARIWTIPCGPCGSSALTSPVQILYHFKGRTNEIFKDVTKLDWNREGTLLATGAIDGQARIWSQDGELKGTLAKHKGPILSLKWNKKGNFLLSGSADKTAIVWDTRTWDCTQQFEFHSAPTVNVDWVNNTCFATCSADKMIYVCKIGEAHPIKAFAGHEEEINEIRWNPAGSLLASCSDDGTAKIWSLKQDNCLFDFREHRKAIYAITWSPTGLCTNYPFQQLILASASGDATINLWEVDHGLRLCSLKGHRDAVYCLAFSPNGQFLASGSLDRCVHVWSVQEGALVKTYNGGGTAFEVSWNKEGDKLAACFSNDRVCVMDFRM